MKDTPPIRVYVGVAVMGHVNSVLGDLVARLGASGLLEAAEVVHVVVCGDSAALTVDMTHPSIKILRGAPDTSQFEFPALEILWSHCMMTEDDADVLYVHTKGVSKSRRNPHIDDWVALLSHFNINDWRARRAELSQGFACTGINFSGDAAALSVHPSLWGLGVAPGHYSGNFWWSKSSHIRRLASPMRWMPTPQPDVWRMMCEMWVCSAPGMSVYNAYSSGVDHYASPYPRSLYESIGGQK